MASQGGAMNVLRDGIEVQQNVLCRRDDKERDTYYACHVGTDDCAVTYVKASNEQEAEEAFRQQHPSLKGHKVTFQLAPGYRPPRAPR